MALFKTCSDQISPCLPHYGYIWHLQYIPRNMHTVFALLCFVEVIHWLIFATSIRLTSLALWQSNDCPSASKATLMNMDKYFMWIHYERLHNHNKQSTTKPCAYFLGYTVWCQMLLYMIWFIMEARLHMLFFLTCTYKSLFIKKGIFKNHSPWASYQIRKMANAHAPGMPGTFSPPPWVSDPDMHHGTCVTHVPWCMPGSLTSSFL